jgi:hypothetical protein
MSRGFRRRTLDRRYTAFVLAVVIRGGRWLVLGTHVAAIDGKAPSASLLTNTPARAIPVGS